MTASLDELTLDVAEVLEEFVAHGVAGVDRSNKPPTYWLLSRENMTADAQAYFDRITRK